MYILVFAISMFLLLFYPKLTQQELIKMPMYVPIHALRKSDICSIMSVAFPLKRDKYWTTRVDSHHSRRTMLYFLLSIKSTLKNKKVLHFIDECYPNFNWSTAETTYLQLKNSHELYQISYRAETLGTYWELKVPIRNSGPLKSREYISRYRSNGFQPNDLKIYWNYNQLQALHLCNRYNPRTDSDARNALRNSPVYQRKHSGTIRFVMSGIQEAVFQIPNDKQIIVLDFADERMPGGYYLENAMTQEEVRIFNKHELIE